METREARNAVCFTPFQELNGSCSAAIKKDSVGDDESAELLAHRSQYPLDSPSARPLPRDQINQNSRTTTGEGADLREMMKLLPQVAMSELGGVR